jgi:hypothetical protein
VSAPNNALDRSASKFLIFALCIKFDVLSSWVSLMVVQFRTSTTSSSEAAVVDDATEDLLPRLTMEVSFMV